MSQNQQQNQQTGVNQQGNADPVDRQTLYANRQQFGLGNPNLQGNLAGRGRGRGRGRGGGRGGGGFRGVPPQTGGINQQQQGQGTIGAQQQLPPEQMAEQAKQMFGPNDPVDRDTLYKNRQQFGLGNPQIQRQQQQAAMNRGQQGQGQGQSGIGGAGTTN